MKIKKKFTDILMREMEVSFYVKMFDPYLFVHEQKKSHHTISLPIDYSNAIEQYHFGNGLLFSLLLNLT